MSSLEIFDTFSSIVKQPIRDDNLLLFKKKVDYCLLCLKEEYREIIRKTFIDHDYEYWWLEIYSEATYYRKRARAIGAFVNLFTFIYDQDITFTSITSITC